MTVILTVAVAVAVALGACAGGEEASNSRTPLGTGGQGGQGGQTGKGGAAAAGGAFFDAGQSQLESIRIEPTSAALVSVDGSQPTQTFTVMGHYVGGGTKEITTGIRFEVDPLSTGSIDSRSGLFIANGLVGGTVKVTATVDEPNSLTASTTVDVTLKQTLIGDGAPNDAESLFDSPISDPANAAGLAYPLDQAVMPQNVYPADIQWHKGTKGDVFRIRLSKPHMTVTTYLLHGGAGFNNHWLVDAEAWRSLAQTDPDDPATIVVDRWVAATSQAVSGETKVNITFAKAALTGSVYYWDIGAVRIMRIDDGVGSAVSFMPTPPSGKDGNKCIGCHSVSNNGRYMAGRLGGGENIGAVFDLTVDLTGNPPPTVYPISTNPASLTWWDSSWSPDDTRLVAAWHANKAERKLKFYDPMAGTEVPVTGTLPAGIQPAWAMSGTKIAYVANPSTWGGQTTNGDIALLNVTGPDQVGATSILHKGSALKDRAEGGTTDCYPTWSPDSKRIAFAHGTGARSDPQFVPKQFSALYIMNADGTNAVRLSTACGGADSTDEFQPNFSPFDEGGYFWLTFLSRRDYGNAVVGSHGTKNQQIWVAAIKKNAAPGEDPSAVPYWLPGQNAKSQNISAFYAPRPCRTDGESCTVNSECCGGDCRPDNNGNLVCSPPPPEQCRELNETCTTSADCCDDRTCVNNVCVNPVPR